MLLVDICCIRHLSEGVLKHQRVCTLHLQQYFRLNSLTFREKEMHIIKKLLKRETFYCTDEEYIRYETSKFLSNIIE